MFGRHAGEYPPKIGEAVAEGARIAAVDFATAQRERHRFRRQAAELAARWDALLTPAAHTTAPRGLGATGDPYFCAPWSAAGLPTIALPSGVGDGRLPLSVQLVGAALAEGRLLAAAAWCERVLSFRAAPPI